MAEKSPKNGLTPPECSRNGKEYSKTNAFTGMTNIKQTY